MIETTITILTQYPFQAVLLATVLSRVVRDGLQVAGGRRGHLPAEAAASRTA